MSNYQRANNRKASQLRDISIETDINIHAEGSVLISFGDTQVLCTASIEQGVPHFRRGKKIGWVTAEYSMLPRSTGTRNRRESSSGKQGGRTLEIQRLIARSLRSMVDMRKLGERTITVDCDVIQADGGTRTASITGGAVALSIAIDSLNTPGIKTGMVAAISVGVVKEQALLDLDYSEDSSADTDMNVVMTDKGGFIELQGTAEKKPFDDNNLMQMVELSKNGIKQLLAIQQQALDNRN